jgi:hypothetical protein
VMACTYEDVQVMWSMLDKARICSAAAAASWSRANLLHPPIRSVRPWRERDRSIHQYIYKHSHSHSLQSKLLGTTAGELQLASYTCSCRLPRRHASSSDSKTFFFQLVSRLVVESESPLLADTRIMVKGRPVCCLGEI